MKLYHGPFQEGTSVENVCHAAKADDGASAENVCHAATPDDMANIDLPGQLVDNWQEKAIAKFKELLGRYRGLRLFMDICVRCGACWDKCPFYLGTGDPRNMPMARAELLRRVYRRYFTMAGRLLGQAVDAEDLSEDLLRDWYRYFYQCSECRRCSVYCPYGIDTAEITMAAREIEDPYLQADALRDLALVAADTDADDAVSLAEAIEPLFIRIQTLIAIGETVAASDTEKAISIFEQALSEAGELDDTYPLGQLARAWAALDAEKALEIADRVEDPPDQVRALTDVALAMLATEPEEAQVTFETAYETAQSIKSNDDPFAAATALRDMAAAWWSDDEAEDEHKAQAGNLYADAFEIAKAVEVEPTGS